MHGNMVQPRRNPAHHDERVKLDARDTMSARTVGTSSQSQITAAARWPARPQRATYKVALFSTINFLIFSTNSVASISSVFSFPRVRTFTLPVSASLSPTTDRKSTRLNSSHVEISYA